MLVFGSDAAGSSIDINVWCFVWEMPPIGSRVGTRGSQQVLLPGKVMEPYRGGTCLKELRHLKLALKLYSLSHFLSSFSLLPVWG